MFWMVDCNWLPTTNELVSPNAGGAASGWGGAAAGADTEGASGAGAGAAAIGGAGVAGAGAAGVAGSGLSATGVLVDAAGVALGYESALTRILNAKEGYQHTFDTIKTKKSFSFIAQDSTVLVSGRTLPTSPYFF